MADDGALLFRRLRVSLQLTVNGRSSERIQRRHHVMGPNWEAAYDCSQQMLTKKRSFGGKQRL
jgi:hypothetical protein